MTTRSSFFAFALTFALAHISGASTIQLYAVPSDIGVDADADGFTGFTYSVSPTPSIPGVLGFDLDDSDLNINPSASEIIDGKDNDQDGVIDGTLGAHSINALPDIELLEGQGFTADWIINGIDSLPNVFLQAFPDGATYSASVTDPLEITATVGWTAQPGDVGHSYLFRIAGPDVDEFTVSVVPEPSTLVLGALGCLALVTIAWMRGGVIRSLLVRRRYR